MSAMATSPRDKEAIVCGLNAALAVLQHRPDAIKRVYYVGARRKDVGALLKHTATLRRPYNEVPPDELEAVAGTVHHEGVVVVTEPLPTVSLPAFLRALAPDAFLIALDGVGNPHNVGAILRSAAWFGASGVILPLDDPRQATLSPAAVRVAQGAAEVVPCVPVPSLLPALKELRRAGVSLVAAEAGTGGSPFEGAPLPRPCCLVLGSEDQGLLPPVRLLCDRRVSIPGSGAVESLNVSVAAGILLASLARHGVGTPPARSVLAAEQDKERTISPPRPARERPHDGGRDRAPGRGRQGPGRGPDRGRGRGR